MNSRSSIGPIIGIAAALLGLFVITSVLLGQGNQLAALCRYLLVAGFVIGLTFPRGGLIVWLMLCGYTDLLKRLMVVFGRVHYNDLYNVLGIPPVMLAGITLAVLVGAFTGRFRLSGTQWRLFAVACVLMLISAALAAKEKGGSLGALVPAIANDGLYAMLIFVVPVLFKMSDDVVRVAKFLLWVFLPVALYGLFQKVNGFQDFEIAYLKSGLTLEIKQLYANEVRAFSTLNSPTAFSVVSGMLCAVSLMLGLTPRREGRGRLLDARLAAVMAFVYLAGVFASTSRSAFLFIAVALGGFFCFRSLTATRLLYAGMAAAFISLILLADVLLANLDTFQNQVSRAAGDGEFATQMSRVGTYSDRLRGFSNLVRNPEVYTLFGYGTERGSDERDPLYSHDLISNNLVTHGVVPVLAMALFGVFVLKRMHGQVLRIADAHHRVLAAGLLSLGFSFFALSAASGSVLSVFPVNAFLWLSFGLFMLVCQSDQQCGSEAAEVPKETMDDTPAETQRAVHRFRRSGAGALNS